VGKKQRVAAQRRAEVARIIVSEVTDAVCDFQIAESTVLPDAAVSLRYFPTAGLGHAPGDWAAVYLRGMEPEVIVYARAAYAKDKPADDPAQPEQSSRSVYRGLVAVLLGGWEMPAPGVYVVTGMEPNGDRVVERVG
jgi:hypothetical protein